MSHVLASGIFRKLFFNLRMNPHKIKSSKIGKAHAVCFWFNNSRSDTQVHNLFESCFNQSVKGVNLQIVYYAEADPLVFFVDNGEKTVVNTILLREEKRIIVEANLKKISEALLHDKRSTVHLKQEVTILKHRRWAFRYAESFFHQSV